MLVLVWLCRVVCGVVCWAGLGRAGIGSGEFALVGGWARGGTVFHFACLRDAENAIGPGAFRHDDIVRFLSGKT